MQKIKAPKLNSKQEKEVKDLVKKISKGAKKKQDDEVEHTAEYYDTERNR